MLDGVEQDGLVQTDVFALALDSQAATTEGARPVETAAAERPAPIAFDVAASLSALGWPAAAAGPRELAALALRGTPTVLAVPHAPAHAGPLVAGLLARLAADRSRRALLLCPAGEESVWAALAAVAAGTSGIRTAAALGPARAQRRIREGDIDLFIASPDTALLLHRRAALKPESFDTVVLAWPLQLETAGEALGVLLADMKDATRLVVVDDAIAAEGIIERYGRKAARVGFPADDAGLPPRSSARTVSVAWDRRVAAVPDLLEMLDPTVATVWTADRTLDAALAQVMSAGDLRLHRATADDAVEGTVICVDLPSPERLAAFAAKGDVVLLVPPTADNSAARMLATRRPLRLPGALEVATTQAASERAVIAKSLESLDATASLLTLAPLFERHDPALVAAALLQLWTQARSTSAAAAAVVPDATPNAPAVAKVFVGIGKRDSATVADLVAVLTKECRVEKQKIGRIELRDAFMLVELPAQEAERIAQALNGASIRRKRITARVDKGMPPRSGGFGGGDRGGNDRGSDRGTFGSGRPTGRFEGRPPRPRE